MPNLFKLQNTSIADTQNCRQRINTDIDKQLAPQQRLHIISNSGTYTGSFKNITQFNGTCAFLRPQRAERGLTATSMPHMARLQQRSTMCGGTCQNRLRRKMFDQSLNVTDTVLQRNDNRAPPDTRKSRNCGILSVKSLYKKNNIVSMTNQLGIPGNMYTGNNMRTCTVFKHNAIMNNSHHGGIIFFKQPYLHPSLIQLSTKKASHGPGADYYYFHMTLP